MQLTMLKKRFPNKSLEELFTHTHTYNYVRTFVEQTGKKMGNIKISEIKQIKIANEWFDSPDKYENLFSCSE